jgi:hypothetical protein
VTGESPAVTVIAVFDAAFANAGSSNDITLGFSPGSVPQHLRGQAPRLHWRSGRAHERAWQGWRDGDSA